MSALQADRPTPQVGGVSGPAVERLSLPVADNVHIYQGALIQVEGGYAYPAGASGTTASSLTIGRADSAADNTVVGHTAGGISVEVAQGCFEWDNGTSNDAIAAANFGAVVYAIDDHTVGLTAGTPAWGAVTHTGTGVVPGMTVTGTPDAAPSPINVLVYVVLGGAVATATFQYSTDGGLTWSATTPTAATVAISNGLTLNFAAGTYVLGDTYKQSWSGTRAPAGRFLGINPVTAMPKVQTITV